MRYYDDDDALESAAIAGASVWCGLLFEGVPPASNWSFTLRYNHSRVPKTARTYDKFTPGLSTKFVKYYSSGFLSLQTALSDAILRERLGTNASDPAAAGDAGLGAAAASSDAGLGAFVYAAPFPTAAYANNRFLDHAGPLVGLVIVLSFLIPLATMLRALVLEKVCSPHLRISPHISAHLRTSPHISAHIRARALRISPHLASSPVRP